MVKTITHPPLALSLFEPFHKSGGWEIHGVGYVVVIIALINVCEVFASETSVVPCSLFLVSFAILIGDNHIRPYTSREFVRQFFCVFDQAF